LSDEATKPLDHIKALLNYCSNYPGIGDILGGTNARLKITMSDVIRRRGQNLQLRINLQNTWFYRRLALTP